MIIGYLDNSQKTRIAQTIKMLMKRALKSNDAKLISDTKKELKVLYMQKIIGFLGLSIKNKFRLWKFTQ